MYIKITIFGVSNDVVEAIDLLRKNAYHFEEIYHDYYVNIYAFNEEVEYIKTILQDNDYEFEVEEY